MCSWSRRRTAFPLPYRTMGPVSTPRPRWRAWALETSANGWRPSRGKWRSPPAKRAPKRMWNWNLSGMEGPINVALVDDHKILTEGLRGLIDNSGWARVAGVAHSAMECRNSLGFWKPQVLLLDVNLPDINGVDFCRELKAGHPDLKILALTTHNEYSIVRQMLDNGASGYLIKNAMGEEVMEGIRAVAHGEVFYSHEVDVVLKREPEKSLWHTHREREFL